jgi:hypothetical protein
MRVSRNAGRCLLRATSDRHLVATVVVNACAFDNGMVVSAHNLPGGGKRPQGGECDATPCSIQPVCLAADFNCNHVITRRETAFYCNRIFHGGGECNGPMDIMCNLVPCTGDFLEPVRDRQGRYLEGNCSAEFVDGIPGVPVVGCEEPDAPRRD